MQTLGLHGINGAGSPERCPGLVSEFPRPFFWPALDHNFGLCEELDRMASLTVEVSKKALACAAERKWRHGRSNADVHTDIADLGLVAELARAGAAARENAGHVSVRAPVHQRDRLLDIPRIDQAQDGPKDLAL